MRISDWSSDVCSSDLVDLGGTGVAHHLHDLEAGRAAHDRIVDQHDALARDQRAVGIVFQLDAKMADLVARLDEGAADIDRKSVVSGKSVEVRVDLGGRRIIKKNKKIRMQRSTF